MFRVDISDNGFMYMKEVKVVFGDKDVEVNLGMMDSNKSVELVKEMVRGCIDMLPVTYLDLADKLMEVEEAL